MTAKIDRTGQTFARLTFVCPDVVSRKWKCLCECGVIVSVFANNVVRGLTRSCGCLNREMVTERMKALRETLPPLNERQARDKAWSLNWRKENREKLKLNARKYREENKAALSEKKRQCYLKKREQYLARVKAGYAADPERYITRARRKATLKAEATPPWVDVDLIKDLYREARRLTKETGIRHHVDHVIPLQNPLVCGLHIHTNMRVIDASENWRKHNSFSIEND